jgi:hypothetical protein
VSPPPRITWAGRPEWVRFDVPSLRRDSTVRGSRPARRILARRPARILLGAVYLAVRRGEPGLGERFTASLGFGTDGVGFPGRYLEDDPLLRSVVSAIVNQYGIVVTIAANDGTRLYAVPFRIDGGGSERRPDAPTLAGAGERTATRQPQPGCRPNCGCDGMFALWPGQPGRQWRSRLPGRRLTGCSTRSPTSTARPVTPTGSTARLCCGGRCPDLRVASRSTWPRWACLVR